MRLLLIPEFEPQLGFEINGVPCKNSRPSHNAGSEPVVFNNSILLRSSVLEHNANLRETLSELFKTCSGSSEVFGNPSPELVEGSSVSRVSTHDTSPSSQPD